jgi:hypothetical protein
MWRVAGFCTLPQMYPSGQKWTAEDNKLYKPITKDIVDDVTHELTFPDVENDPNWITKSTCIVTSNVDRAIISAEAAKAFGKHNNVPILEWKRKYTRCAWAGGTFFQLCCCVSFLILAGNRYWFYILMYLEYNTVVALY